MPPSAAPIALRLARQPLGRQLAAAVVLSLVPAVALVAWSGVLTLREQNAELRSQVGVIAQTTAAYVNGSFGEIDRVAGAVTRAPFVQAMEPVESQQLVERLALSRLDVQAIALLDAAGRDVAVFRRPAVAGPLPRAGLDRALAGRSRVIESLDGPAPLQIVAWYPVENPEGLAGAIGFYLNVEGLRGVLGALDLHPDAFVSLGDAAGRVVAHSATPEFVGQVVAPNAVQGGPVVYDVRTGLDGVERAIAEVFLADAPFVLRAGIPTVIASEAARTLWARNATGVAFGLVVWLGVALLLASRLTRSVGDLGAAAKRIADGDLGPVAKTPMPSREFAELQEGFATMVARLDESQRELARQRDEERRIRTEVESLQSQVVRQERLAAVGQLVAGVAHEINNPLQAILGFADLLQAQQALPEPARKDLALIQHEAERACAIIRNLATFARQKPTAAEPVRLGAVIGTVAELRGHRLHLNNIELRIEDTSAQEVRAVATELQQVLLNLVVNAEQAIVAAGAPGRVTIRAWDEGGFVRVEVEDTGPGVPPEDERRLFEPFFTTKPVGQGTGLGLSVSHGIIESHGGRMGYRRSAAGGAVFHFELPAIEPAAPDAPAP